MLSTELKRKLATVKSLKADVSSVSASSQRLKLETLGGQIYVFNSADDAKLPCFVHFVGSQEVWAFKMAPE